MNRRLFRVVQAFALLAAAVPQSRSLGEVASIDIIDCHTHFFDPTRPEGVPWPGKGTSLYRTVLPKHLKALPQFRPVTGTVIVEASKWPEDNAWLLQLAKDDPFVVGIVGNLLPGDPAFADNARRFAKDPLFRGIRISEQALASLLEKNTLDDLQLLAELDLSLDVNGGPDTPGLVAVLAVRCPNLRIVINHIGNVAVTAEPPPAKWRAGIAAAAAQPNVFCKISALVEGASRNGAKAPTENAFYKPYIDVVWNAFGDDRVIFGSNWPASENATDYATLQRIALEYAFAKGEVPARKFCALNAKRAYKWVDRPGRLSPSK
jgi:predicted TIM-barrel fold metal-dependent hydrolase